MPETIIESVLNGKLDSELLKKWLNNESIDDAPDDCILHCCKRNEFVAYFLTFLRNQTDSILQTNTNALQILQNSTPEKLRHRKHHRSISEPTSDDRSTDTLTVNVKNDSKTHESPNRERKRAGRRVKTKLFTDDRKDVSMSSDESRLSSSFDRLATSSTPLKNGTKLSDYPQSVSSPVTPRCDTPRDTTRDTPRDTTRDTPRVNHRHSRSHEKSCLGDYIVDATRKEKKKSKKNTSSDKEDKTELDISNSEMFPEIGARKASSLRSDKRRIKPTNIDKSQKSLSLSSFNSDCFQSSPLAENSAFKQQKFEPKEQSNYENERNILKQERHKLMEKFNILNTDITEKTPPTPQIKITQKETIENPNYIKIDATKIQFKEKIELLIGIYNIMLKNYLILSVNTEIYFLISILISKQTEEDYLKVEKELNLNNFGFILQNINNSTYFAVKSLWNERSTLEVILDKNSLKTLGENKKVRQFSPELAKCLLNCYCVRSEAAPPQPPPPHTLVAYNVETDNIDNFTGNNHYHVFKKQRDMFYEIVRWYNEATTTSSSSTTSLRSRVRALVSTGGIHTHSHLATLFVQHLMCTCVYGDPQESKLSKLQRRLTCPTSSDSHRLPTFTSAENFYKEFILHAESESFRAHLRDVLSSEIINLDNTHITSEDRGNSKNTLEYLKLAKKLALLAKFLGFLTSLPYCQLPNEFNSKNNNNIIIVNKDHNYMAPKEKVLENNLALRNYTQPQIDLKGIIENAIENSRTIITIPWLVHFLAMLDYTTLRLKYYQNTLKILLNIYHNKLKDNKILKKHSVIYLKSILGWLFDLPHFPTDLIESDNLTDMIIQEKINNYQILKLTDNNQEKLSDNNQVGKLKLTDNNQIVKSKLNDNNQTEKSKLTDNEIQKLNNYVEKLKLTDNNQIEKLPNNNQIEKLKLTDNNQIEKLSDLIDSFDLIDESIILELCPSLKDINNLLLTCRLSQDGRHLGSFRHITPVSLNVNPEDRVKNKEKELQSRLEEEFLRSLPSSWRKILEVVSERSLATVLREVTAHILPRAIRDANKHASDIVHTLHGDQPTRLSQLTSIYNTHLENLRTSALEFGSSRLRTRTRDAISALLPTAPRELHIVAFRNSKKRLNNWLNEHWNNTGVLCKNIQSLSLFTSPVELRHRDVTPPSRAPPTHGIAQHLIDVKEAISQLLEDNNPTRIFKLLTIAAQVAKETVGMQRKTHVQLTVDLCVVYVAKRPKEVTDQFLNKLHAIWHTYCPERKPNTPEELTLPERRPDLSPELRNFDDDDDRVVTPISDDDEIVHLGQNSAVLGQNSVILGQNSAVLGQNSVILGQNSGFKNLNSAKTDKTTVGKTSMTLSPCTTPLSPSARPLSSTGRPLSPGGRPRSPIRRPLSPIAKSFSLCAAPLSLGRPLSPNGRPRSPMGIPLSPNAKSFSMSVNSLSTYSGPLSPGRPLSPNGRPRSPIGRPLSPIAKSYSITETQLSGKVGPLSPGRPLSPNGRPRSPIGRPLSPIAKSYSISGTQLSAKSGPLSPGRPLSPNGRPRSPIGRPLSPIAKSYSISGTQLSAKSGPFSPGRPLSPNGRPRSPIGRPLSPIAKSYSISGTQLSAKSGPLSPGRPLSPNGRPRSPIGKSLSLTGTPLLSTSRPHSPKPGPLSLKTTPLSPVAKPLSPGIKQFSPNMTKTEVNEENEQLLEYFNRILCPRNIVMFSVSNSVQSEIWDSLANVLVFLLKNDFLTEDSLTEQCLAVYRQDWNQTTLSNMSVCMKSVSSRWGNARAGKFTLFLEFLAEYCGDMSYDVDNSFTFN